MSPEQRDALRAAMQLDVPAFPCDANKRPTTPNGFKGACLPSSGLATLWAQYPGELVGVPTGEASGICVLDIDPDGRAWWIGNKARLPETRLHRTRRGGIHALFQHKTGVRNSVGKIAPGVDVRGDGGYVIWWAACGLAVHEHALAPWPDALMQATKPATNVVQFVRVGSPLTERPGGPMSPKTIGIIQRLRRAQPGERNAIAYWAACRIADMLRSGELAASVAYASDLLLLASVDAGLPEIEAQKTIASGLRG